MGEAIGEIVVFSVGVAFSPIAIVALVARAQRPGAGSGNTTRNTSSSRVPHLSWHEHLDVDEHVPPLRGSRDRPSPDAGRGHASGAEMPFPR